MSDSENDFQTSDYFSESTPKSCKSFGLDHKYARSPCSVITNSSKTSFTSIESEGQLVPKLKLKRRKLFAKECPTNKTSVKVIPLSERQQLAIALQLSSTTSESESHNTNERNESILSANNGNSVVKSAQRVRRNHKGETGLHIAAIKGDLNRVKQIIKEDKYPVDITDFAGWAPIHEACNRGHIFVVEELLKAGSDVNARGHNNDTPLIDAAVNGHHLLVRLLLRHGADYTLKNNSNKTAIDVSKSIRVLEVINCYIIDKMRRNGIESSEIDKESNVSVKISTSNGNSNMASTESTAPKVPPLRIVLPASSANTTSSSNTSSNSGAHPSVSLSAPSSTSSTTTKFPYVVSSEESVQSEGESVSGTVASQRITRSSQRVAQQQSHKSGTSGDHPSDSEEPSLQNASTDSQHPRKRKIRNNNNESKNGANTASNSNGDNDNDSSSSTSSVGLNQKDVSPFALPQTNCYQMYLSIRRNVDKKRREMFSVSPKAPQGFDEFMLNRCSYLLAGPKTTGSEGAAALPKPTIEPPPPSLCNSRMSEVFVAQEKERYKLKIQHLIERQKLVLSAEQEILRVHGRAARAMANQSLPFSVCSILKDEEIYNIVETESEQNESLIKSEKGVTAGTSGLSANRTRYNGRLFLSWLQDVGDKWEKTKKVMILRHKKESDSLLAMQRLEWEWKLKEFGLCDLKTCPHIDDTHVPKVGVSDTFELPA